MTKRAKAIPMSQPKSLLVALSAHVDAPVVPVIQLPVAPRTLKKAPTL
jgi:hypothetical protein